MISIDINKERKDKDKIKDSFQKIRLDMNNLNKEINEVKNTISELKNEMISLCDIMRGFSHKLTSSNLESEDPLHTLEIPSSAYDFLTRKEEEYQKKSKNNPDLSEKPSFDTSTHNSTDRQINKTDNEDSSTDNSLFKPSKPQIYGISTGNQGVSTDRQTNRQTDKNIQKEAISPKKEDSIENATNILDSLDNIKKELRIKFKQLTDQEIAVFSTIYQLEEEKGFATYKTLSEKLNLTQSSIRDYISRLLIKGIPVDKIKINNKNIQLKISNNLKKIASLSTLLKLREI